MVRFLSVFAFVTLLFWPILGPAFAAEADYAVVLTAPQDEMVATGTDADGNGIYTKVTHPIGYVISVMVWDSVAQPNYRPQAGTRLVPRGSLNIKDVVP